MALWKTGNLVGLVGLAIVCLVAPAQAADSIWDIEAVDANGVGTDPRIGADPSDPNSWVTVEGIALNASAEMLDPNIMWQVYVQGEAPDAGGIAAWHGIWFNPSGWSWPPFPDVNAGDRIRIDALISDHNGKVNINSRHSSDPGMQFYVTVLDANVGMPTARLIADIAACNFFDQTRATGGEQYQAQWVQLNEVSIVSGTWGAGETLVITDDSGQQLNMLLSDMGDFDSYPEPIGAFSVRGIFDQEDPTPPATGDYRIWLKSFADLRFALNVDVVSANPDKVTLSPTPDDPNLGEYAPDDANSVTKYPGGTEVMLTANPAGTGKSFLHWEIYDPNDLSVAAIDANSTITVTMDNERMLVAIYEVDCGSGVGPMMPLIFAALGLAVLRRRWV